MTYNFATDIEERNPWTGNVYYISRMTSDWAERHPLNVGDVIEGVYREFEGTEFEESREELWRVWTAVLSVSSPQGDASLYPNRGGRRRAAAMKVWLLAGDYWRRGFRTGDVLPAIVPGHTITRLPEGGWICLFPREMHLLEDMESAVAEAPVTEAANNQLVDEDSIIEPANNQAPEVPYIEPEPIVVEPIAIEPEPAVVVAPVIETPAIDQTTPNPIPEQSSPTRSLSYSGGETAPSVAVSPSAEPAAPRRPQRDINRERRHHRRLEREAQQRSYEERLAREAQEAEEYARQQERRKIFAALGAVAVTLVMIYFFGLLGPAVFGLLAGGLLKG